MKISSANRLLVGARLLWLVLTLAVAPRAAAQVLYGSILGSVLDASNAPVPGAEVLLAHLATGEERKSVTNPSGEYSFPSLAAGTYNVTITKVGFQTFPATGLEVGVDQIARLNAKLQVGSVKQSVQVSAQSAQLQSDSAELRDEVPEKSLEDLPAPANRSFENL